ncbi:hypothetical protein ACKGJO_07940 [Gracilimonas sp. Q87]|uniref:hypothetical protein n=1 Tax=Gracilimonas sp. Q87 TaxID=3384766 RepID=UPI003983EE83
MKSFLIWLLATFIGAALGFGISWLTGINLYLSLGIGIILGSSAGVTANMDRVREIGYGLKIDTPIPDPLKTEEKVKSSVKTNQKAN